MYLQAVWRKHTLDSTKKKKRNDPLKIFYKHTKKREIEIRKIGQNSPTAQAVCDTHTHTHTENAINFQFWVLYYNVQYSLY